MTAVCSELNDDQLDYIDQVFDRSRKLVQTQVWQGIKEQRLESWIGCLKNHNAELLGAYLLDNLCFRSKEQFNSMLDVLFVDTQVPGLAADSITGLLELITKKPTKYDDIEICLAPVIDQLSPPTKSGPYILRLAQRRYGINSDWLAWPNQLKQFSNLKHLFFVDDFCGTGIQFTEFAERIDLTSICKDNPKLRVTYLVATIHESGMKKIQEEFPNVHIKMSERLILTNSVLSDECFARYQVDGFKNLVTQQYENIVSNVGLPQKGKLAKGYGELGLAYAFTHATPNNTLPIFWYETDHWTPLLDR